MDEKTPHIHATVVPIVTGERRKAKQKKEKTKKKYKTKSVNAPRLCADDMTNREKFIHFQNTYAIAMNKYGLQRGKEGSEARHISTQQYYRDLVDKNEKLEENIETLHERTKRRSQSGIIPHQKRNKDRKTEKFGSERSNICNRRYWLCFR